MKDLLRLLHPSLRRLPGFLTLVVAFSTIAGVSQEKAAPHLSRDDNALKFIGSLGPVPNSPIAKFTEIVFENYTDKTVHLTVGFGSTDGPPGIGVFEGMIAPKAPGCLPVIVRFVLPPAQYAIHTGLSLDLLGWGDIQGLPSYSYSFFLGSVPSGCAGADSLNTAGPQPPKESGGTTISSQIDRIANGSHQALPAPLQSSLAPGQNPGWSIENATGYQLHLYLSGPAERDYVIPNGNSINVDLPPGIYRIAADVSSKSVIPFYAVRQLNVNARWTSHFYIGRQ
ncbi:MAG: hypothetical protein ABSD98_03650 [Candidatus Korobacteraceae bacterium]|jgi:hypothetical protein